MQPCGYSKNRIGLSIIISHELDQWSLISIFEILMNSGEEAPHTLLTYFVAINPSQVNSAGYLGVQLFAAGNVSLGQRTNRFTEFLKAGYIHAGFHLT